LQAGLTQNLEILITLVFISVLADDYSFDFESRTTQYLKGWVDGIYNNTSNYQKGFYWYLEFPWQIAKNIFYEETISEISNHIRNKGQQFIWISNVNDRVNLNNTDIKLLSKYFTHVFVQPHYYQTMESLLHRELKRTS